MPGSKCYILVEGHGEVGAAHNLVTRLSADLEFYLPWAPPLRWKNLHQWQGKVHGGIKAGAEFARGKPDIAALLILRDEDDGCPAEIAPCIADQLRELKLPFPTAFVLLRPEYEVLFLPCLDRMTAVGFPSGLSWDGQSWEARRDVKGWLSAQLPRGRAYKPTVNQLEMTRQLDFRALRAADVPCFGSLERGLAFLRQHVGALGQVYPPCAASTP